MLNKAMNRNLPLPTPEAQKISFQLLSEIIKEIRSTGAISFARFMELALYSPRLGYYRNGLQKFGRTGDFITAPELSPLFSQCVAKQCQQIITQLLPSPSDILELGPGSGIMAKVIIEELAARNSLPAHYYLLELSSELKKRQQLYLQEHIPEFYSIFTWLDELPSYPFTGTILANEVVDAMPVNKFCWQDNKLYEFFVDLNPAFAETHPDFIENLPENLLEWRLKAPSCTKFIKQFDHLNIKADHYSSEMNLLLPNWIASLAHILHQGLILIIDYGFPQSEYYHPDRNDGTLMCHYQHRSHSNPLILPGLQDITAHVNFTAITEAALKHQLTLSGYTHQAGFLLNCGIDQLFSTELAKSAESLSHEQSKIHYNLSQQLKMLTLPSEMGELFKAIALTKRIHVPLLGFTHFNQLSRLA